MTNLKNIHVEVKNDHLSKVASGRPVPSLSELIWNSLDADATDVKVKFIENYIGIEEIQIHDNGHGIEFTQAEKCFSSLGGSWKKHSMMSKGKNRHLHGQEGKGRFKAFALGRVVDWVICYETNDSEIYEYTVTGLADDLGNFKRTLSRKSSSNKAGVTVKISELHKQFKLLKTDYCVENLSPIFAVYLAQYTDCNIQVENKKVDPSSLILSKKEFDLDAINYNGDKYGYKLELVEWENLKEKGFYFCNSSGFPLEKYDKNIIGIGNYSYSAYLKSDHISILSQKGLLSLANLEPSLTHVINAATNIIKDHFVEKKRKEDAGIIQQWKDELVYPFLKEGVNPIEIAERQVFDIVAINVSKSIPDFETANKKSKTFQLRMLRLVLENSAEELETIILEVLQLSKIKQFELAELLREASLTSIINASKIVSDRLKSILGLENLIFDPVSKRNFKERSQLHKIIEKNIWLFGDEYSLALSDKSLTKVLIKHKKLINENVIIDDEPVKTLDKKTGIVDLMLSSSIAKNHKDEREHLIIELKAPKVKIGEKEINQIQKYAFAVASDERFKNVNTKWDFWILSNDISDYADMMRNQDNYKRGIIYKSGIKSGVDITIFVKTWSEIFQECKFRHEFIQSQLNINIDSDASTVYLTKKYKEYTQGL